MGKPSGKSGRGSFDARRARGADDAEDAGLFGQPLNTPAPSPPGSEKAPLQPAAAEQAAGAAGSPLTVAQVARLIKGAINAAFTGTVHVVGELSNISRGGAGGHLYFTLKDSAAELRCVMWQSAAATMKFRPIDGLAVVATGQIDVFEPRGQVQFYVRRIEPRGVGALELAFRQLKDRLQREGLFDAARKRPLPRLPRRIAVVTSPTGAAVRDILTTLERRFPAVEVLIYGVRVQGEGAAGEIADAIGRINRSAAALGGVDVMIVGRGGGSLEDLWAFNEEVVARAIFASGIPVVSAVGHEVDYTIADFVADVRAPTPTAAAELVVPVRAELLAGLSESAARFDRAALRFLERCRSRLALAERCEWFRDPAGRVRQRGQQLDEAMGRLQLAKSRYLDARRAAVHRLEVRLTRVQPAAVLSARREALAAAGHRLRLAGERLARTLEGRLRDAARRLAAVGLPQVIGQKRVWIDQVERRLRAGAERAMDRRRLALEAIDKRLHAVGHENVLRRGFTLTRRAADGTLVRAAGDVRPDELVQTQTADGAFRSRVTGDGA